MIVGGSIMGGRKMVFRWLSMVAMVVFGLLVLPPAFARAAAGEGCPNEALRSELSSGGLPDCRAYEMVSPAYKEGYPVLSPVAGGSYSANGDEGIVYSSGDLAGAEGDGEEGAEAVLYSVTRTSVGWQLSPLNPPLSQFVGQFPLGVEVDTGYTLWDQHTPLQSTRTNDLYIRSPAKAGSPAKYSMVGPLREIKTSNEEEASNVISPEELVSVAATTNNYEHIVLFTYFPQSEGWPSFDHTSGSSLYEYSGTDNKQPILVGVTGPKRSEDLIKACGTLLGGGVSRHGSSAYNALSANGEAIFFTVEPCNKADESAEIYERLHGSIVSKEAASTIDVSESECSGCGAESGKSFEGASENGERVFFTSTQKLTSEAVDGTAGGNAVEEGVGGCSKIPAGKGGCNLYEYVSAPGGGRGHLQTVASGEVLGVAGMAEDGARIYYVSRNAVPGAGKGPRETEPRAGDNNLYVYDTTTEKTTFIATFGEEGEDFMWGKIFGLKPVEVTGDEGQFLLFVSQTQGLVPGDTSEFAQLFEYDAETGELERLTKGENGYNDDGNAVSMGILPESISNIAQWLGEADYKTTTNRLNISEDGRTVAFETGGQLSERAVSTARDCTSVYEFHTAGRLSEGSVHLVSDGRDVQPDKGSGCGAVFLAMDASGANILFSTADELVPGDTDGTQRDIYDAREDGGFSSPVSSAVCEGGCEGPVSAPPVFGAPASASLMGSGNLVAPAPTTTTPKATVKKAVRCAKGERRSHGKCVKPKIKSKRKKAKRAEHGRGSK
jgi:hypothetical protein